MLNYAAKSDIGCHRSNNEDNFVAAPDLNLWILADGVGGHDAGEVASEIVCRVIHEQVAAGATLEEAIHRAHDAVLAAPEEGQGRPGMASTVVVLRVDGERFQVSWVGDSRCYLWSEDRGLEQVSRDHSLVQRLLEEQHITEEEAASHPGRNVVLQALGQENIDRLQVDSITDRFEDGQVLMMCSDGLNDYVERDDIVAAFQPGRDMQELVDHLIKKTLDNDGADNVTVVAVRLDRASLSDTSGAGPSGAAVNSQRRDWLRHPATWLAAAVALGVLVYLL